MMIAVVAGEDDDRFLIEPGLLERIENFAHLGVHERDGGVVSAFFCHRKSNGVLDG